MGEEPRLPKHNEEEMQENEQPKKGILSCVSSPVSWFKMLAKELHWSFVFGVMVVYGISQGLGGSLARVGTEYYMKDVQKVLPSEAQVYSGITSIPWIIKPLWGLLTDVVPILGYHRRSYFVFAGFLGVIAMLSLSLHNELHIVLALLFLTAGSASVAIADVTVDACVAQNSGTHPSLAADMQSLCALSSSIGSLVGFSISGIFVHLIGPQGVFGLLMIPAGLVLLVGVLVKEPRTSFVEYKQINQNFVNASKAVWKTLKLPDVWRPCLYMYVSFSLSLNISEGMFYWATDSKAGPSFSKILSCLAGMLDLVLVRRWNLKFGLPDILFVVIDASVSQLIGRLKWMPLLVLSAKICPPGIEGTFFALLMSIDNAGLLTASWLGGLLLHVFNVTRTEFDKFWMAILIRNLIRITPLFLLFLVPRADPNSTIFTDEVLDSNEDPGVQEFDDVELVALVKSVDRG
ncbi:probable folate-biopterin transporter 2 isoform X2 [Primulina huaijiensis]|uniref:probable folate-biopterin transporter 2 isoform X2 n=1 Tax=Primulina huaijiensis TaxID=1492673 RepID=UPI003CC70BD2